GPSGSATQEKSSSPISSPTVSSASSAILRKARSPAARPYRTSQAAISPGFQRASSPRARFRDKQGPLLVASLSVPATLNWRAIEMQRPELEHSGSVGLRRRAQEDTHGSTLHPFSRRRAR